MTKHFNKFKNPVFGPFLVHFPKFSGKKFFPENPALSRTTSYGFLGACQNSEKIMIKFKKTPGQDGRTLFHRTLPTTAKGPIIVLKILKRPCGTIRGGMHCIVNIIQYVNSINSIYKKCIFKSRKSLYKTPVDYFHQT